MKLFSGLRWKLHKIAVRFGLAQMTKAEEMEKLIERVAYRTACRLRFSANGGGVGIKILSPFELMWLRRISKIQSAVCQVLGLKSRTPL